MEETDIFTGFGFSEFEFSKKRFQCKRWFHRIDETASFNERLSQISFDYLL